MTKEITENTEGVTRIMVAGALITRETPGGIEILMARRLIYPEINRYSPPGGKLEAGETSRECVRREIAEECGLSLDASCLDKIFIGPNTFRKTRTYYHYCGYRVPWSPEMGDPINAQPDKHTDWEWMSMFKLEQLDAQCKLSLVAQALLEGFKHKNQTGKPLRKAFSANRLLQDL